MSAATVHGIKVRAMHRPVLLKIDYTVMVAERWVGRSITARYSIDGTETKADMECARTYSPDDKEVA